MEWHARGQTNSKYFTLDSSEGESYSAVLYNPSIPSLALIFDDVQSSWSTSSADYLNIWPSLGYVSSGGEIDVLRDWGLGAVFNNPDFSDRANYYASEYTYWQDVNASLIYPDPFDSNLPMFGACFAAYVSGAHGYDTILHE